MGEYMCAGELWRLPVSMAIAEIFLSQCLLSFFF